MTGPDLVCVGETMVLVTPTDGRLGGAHAATLAPAGAESTVALYLTDLGHRAAWLSRLGADPLGDRVLGELRDAGVDVSLVARDDRAPTGVYFKDPAPGATAVYYYRAGSAAARLGPADLDRLDLSAVRGVHLTGVTPALSDSCRELAFALFERAGAAGVRRSFDVNHRPGLWPAERAAPVLAELAGQADLVFVGRDEAARVWGTDTPAQAGTLLGGPGRAVVVKDAEVGATLIEGDREVFEPAPAVDVVEPVGAGDAFAAGYLSGLLRGLDPAARLRLGHRVAGYALRSVRDHADARDLRAELDRTS
jgi:2-dehydro-3-deoxygluconokinase